MKNILLAFGITIISGLAITNNVAAQNNELGIYEEDMPDLSRPIMIHVPDEPAVNDTLKDINEKAVKNFQKSFPGTNGPSWYRVPGGYIASFKENGIETKAAYNTRGRLQHTISYYHEDMLPRDLKNMVKNRYDDYAIVGIAEVHLNTPDAEAAYVLTIQNEKTLRVLTISDNEVLSEKKYQRG